MSKRNIAYIKPQDPKFLQQLKQQIGYKEGPSTETKKQKLDNLDGAFSKGEDTQREDEKPQIVVINSGDLTAEEVAAEEKRLTKEADEAPADLSKPITFRKTHKPIGDLTFGTSLSSIKGKKDKQRKSRGKASSKKNTVKISFSDVEEDY